MFKANPFNQSEMFAANPFGNKDLGRALGSASIDLPGEEPNLKKVKMTDSD